jgi:hypothetical protein
MEILLNENSMSTDAALRGGRMPAGTESVLSHPRRDRARVIIGHGALRG